jgi:polysaccharide export outer membrane protein
MARNYVRVAVCVAAISLSACTHFLPTIGPSRGEISRANLGTRWSESVPTIQIIDIDEKVTKQLLVRRSQKLFSETLGNPPLAPRTIGRGDTLEISIWEAAPQTLFTTPASISGIATTHATTLPEQFVDEDGEIMVPFAGRIHAAGMTLRELQEEIVRRLTNKANQPEVLVRMTRNTSANATVVGDVAASVRVPLVPGSERLLDALAAAGGVRQPISKTTIQITRGERVYALPLDTIIRDPRQNIRLQPGDVVTALFQPYSFTALGATGKNEEINFESQGITLAQALARSGGLIDSRSNAKGVFIFRLESENALAWPTQPAYATPQGKVPVVFRIDLTNPRSLFLIQDFWIENRDILYVSNAPINEVQKFLNLVFSVAYPIFQAEQSGVL